MLTKDFEARAREVAGYENTEPISPTGLRVLLRDTLAELDETRERIARLRIGNWRNVQEEPFEVCDVSECHRPRCWTRYYTLGGLTCEQIVCDYHHGIASKEQP
jgi:hypothetical protein